MPDEATRRKGIGMQSEFAADSKPVGKDWCAEAQTRAPFTTQIFHIQLAFIAL
jgi:hypothetical protein